MHGKISVIICTFNGSSTLGACLESIARQNWPGNMEVLIVDGGSTDNTRDIAGRCMDRHPEIGFMIIDNPNRLPEGLGNGKWLGYSRAAGDILAFIDQDNVLQRADLFTSAAERLSTRPVLGVLGCVTHDPADPPVVRYSALLGTDSFLAYRSLDNMRTDRLIRAFEEDEYAEYRMFENNMLLAGGNCFFYRKKDLAEIGGYSRDVLVVKKLLKKYPFTGSIRSATKHYVAGSMAGLAAKKFKWGQTYFQQDSERFDYLPRTRREFLFFARNLAFALLILPNFYYAARIFVKSKDLICYSYPLMSFANALAYGYNLVAYKLRR